MAENPKADRGVFQNGHGTPRYRGRIAPSPTGYLHLGHARTFWIAQERARRRGGQLILRNEDLDPARSRPEFVRAFIEDLQWLGIHWDEGPDIGGPFAPYNQSARTALYRAALDELRTRGCVYPCTCSRKDLQSAAHAPHAADDELIYPGTCREKPAQPGRPCHWRFRVSDGESITFHDGSFGRQHFVAGKEFGDFVVWRSDDVPAYQLAVVVDDAAMKITEVVRGADLLVSTARQLLLYRALGLTAPEFFHCPLMVDEHGERLAKRHDSLSLRSLRARGNSPSEIARQWTPPSDATL